jgi:hypothetical protein
LSEDEYEVDSQRSEVMDKKPGVLKWCGVGVTKSGTKSGIRQSGSEW